MADALTHTHTASSSSWQAENGPAGPSNPDAILTWLVTLTSGDGEEHLLRIPHAEGDPAPTWTGVRDHLAALPEEHALAGARLARPVSGVRYVELFTAEEYGKMRRSGDDEVQYLLLLAQKADTVDLTRNRVVEGVQYLEAIGILAEGRAAMVLSNTAPNTTLDS